MAIQMRRKLRKIHPLKSAVYLLRALRDRAIWNRKARNRWLDDWYEQEDPWNYETCPEEGARFRSALNLLDIAGKNREFESAMEIGCAEGVFTAMLAPRCKSLLSVDISQAALDRLKRRLAGDSIRFERWDLNSSPVPNDVDLVVLMDVLELFYQPSLIRNACCKVVKALRPGGYLLLGNSRQNEIFERAWWGKWLLRGGGRIAEHFAAHPRLQLIATERDSLYVNTLFRAN